MPRKTTKNNTTGGNNNVSDYRHSSKRKNIPEAGIAAQGRIAEVARTRFSYNPHLPPVLRFDPTGQADRLPELLETAQRRALTPEEAQMLAEALRTQQPWLEWSGKREQEWFEVDPVALHIHERIAAQAILKLAMREPLQRSLFADPELEYREAVQFYQHDVDWANRLILGDSLTVMHSLARREDLAGKVQMIYIDPPYGIRFASNFQPQVGKRDVKDKESDLTREPEQIRAYRDTWTFGVHSYLTYLRDRLILAKELLTETGSIFVQIGDENVHLIRSLLDDVFGNENFCGEIIYRKTTGANSPMARVNVIATTSDFILWYAKKKEFIKYRQLYLFKDIRELEGYNSLEFPFGQERKMIIGEIENTSTVPSGGRIFQSENATSMGWSETLSKPFGYAGEIFTLSTTAHWKTTALGMQRLSQANRLIPHGNTLNYKRYLDDFPVYPLTHLWTDINVGYASDPKIYVVQSSTQTIMRCLLMTTDPGDLVLDPTCGSGTTAYVAEQWGRRWITIDTSRVAIALARQRLLTAKFDYYELRDEHHGPTGGFVYRTVPHITLKSIAQNQALDPIFAKWEPVLAEKLARLNAALALVSPECRARLKAKLVAREKAGGKSSITDADRRRWLLPASRWEEWEVPFDTDADWPEELQAALNEYRAAWRSKMDEVNACIQASAPQEELVDQPNVIRKVLRVSGPFTVEGVQPVEETLAEESPIEGAPGEYNPDPTADWEADEPVNGEAFIEKIIRLLRKDGVRFPDNKVASFERLEPLARSILQAAGEWNNGRRVAVAVGPQYGPITAKQVEECLREAYRRGYDDLVFAGFAFDGAAQAVIQEDANPQVRCHLAHIRPDVNMGDLLKETPGNQLFTVFGEPRVDLQQLGSGEWQVRMEGVDVYDPVTNALISTGANKVAAWFLDCDYDGRTFCVSQAFFPDSNAWDRIAAALRTQVDPERFEAFSGTLSLPFTAGAQRRIAVKVIDPRGNEVMRVMRLGS